MTIKIETQLNQAIKQWRKMRWDENKYIGHRTDEVKRIEKNEIKTEEFLRNLFQERDEMFKSFKIATEQVPYDSYTSLNIIRNFMNQISAWGKTWKLLVKDKMGLVISD